MIDNINISMLLIIFFIKDPKLDQNKARLTYEYIWINVFHF